MTTADPGDFFLKTEVPDFFMPTAPSFLGTEAFDVDFPMNTEGLPLGVSDLPPGMDFTTANLPLEFGASEADLPFPDPTVASMDLFGNPTSAGQDLLFGQPTEENNFFDLPTRATMNFKQSTMPLDTSVFATTNAPETDSFFQEQTTGSDLFFNPSEAPLNIGTSRPFNPLAPLATEMPSFPSEMPNLNFDQTTPESLFPNISPTARLQTALPELDRMTGEPFEVTQTRAVSSDQLVTTGDMFDGMDLTGGTGLPPLGSTALPGFEPTQPGLLFPQQTTQVFNFPEGLPTEDPLQLETTGSRFPGTDESLPQLSATSFPLNSETTNSLIDDGSGSDPGFPNPTSLSDQLNSSNAIREAISTTASLQTTGPVQTSTQASGSTIGLTGSSAQVSSNVMTSNEPGTVVSDCPKDFYNKYNRTKLKFK